MTGISGTGNRNKVPMFAQDEKLQNIQLSGSRGTVALDRMGDLKIKSAFFNGLAKIGSLFSTKVQTANKETKQEFLRALKSEFGLSEAGVERFARKIDADKGTPLKMSDAKQCLSMLSKHRVMSEYSTRKTEIDSFDDLAKPQTGSKKESKFVSIELGVVDFEDLTAEMNTKFKEFNKAGEMRGVNLTIEGKLEEHVEAIGTGAMKNEIMSMKKDPMTTAEDLRDAVVNWMALKGMTQGEIETNLDQTLHELDAFPNEKSDDVPRQEDVKINGLGIDPSKLDELLDQVKEDIPNGEDTMPKLGLGVDLSSMGNTSELDEILDQVQVDVSNDDGKISTTESLDSEGIDPGDLDDLLNDLDVDTYDPSVSVDGDGLVDLVDELETKGDHVDQNIETSTKGSLLDQYIDDLENRDISSDTEVQEKKEKKVHHHDGVEMSILEELQQSQQQQRTPVNVEAIKQHNAELLAVVGLSGQTPPSLDNN